MAARAERPEDVEQAPSGQAKRRTPAEVRATVVGFLAELRVLINYGLAALFWLVASAVLARLIRRLG